METCGVNETAKEGMKWEQGGARRVCKAADGMRPGGPTQTKPRRTMTPQSRLHRAGVGHGLTRSALLRPGRVPLEEQDLKGSSRS